MTFTTGHVAAMSGASLRQLQWWDERGVVRPEHDGHKRIYDSTQAALCIVTMELRNRGLTLQRSRRLIRQIERVLNVWVPATVATFLVTNGKTVSTITDLAELERWRESPVYLVYLNPIMGMVNCDSERERNILRRAMTAGKSANVKGVA